MLDLRERGYNGGGVSFSMEERKAKLSVWDSLFVGEEEM